VIAARPGRLTIGMVLILIAALSVGCGGSGGTKQVSLAQLAENQELYDAEQVSTSGVVREEPNGRRGSVFVLSDGRGDLVELEPAGKAASYIGRRVAVSGRFELDPRVGRVIEDSRISAPR
jgi:hypothetical protein